MANLRKNCRWHVANFIFEQEDEFLEKIMFSVKPHFHLNGYVNNPVKKLIGADWDELMAVNSF